MEIGAIDTMNLAAAHTRHAIGAADGSFDAMLRRGLEAPGGAPGAEDSDNSVRAAAEEFVSMALVEPVLAQSRAMNMAAAPFGPGSHEKAFGPMLDATWSKNLVKASGWGLVDRVEQWMRQRSAGTEVTNG